MFFSPEIVAQFAVGAAAGIGQTFGHRLVPWAIKSWRWLTGSPSRPSTAPVIRRVTAADLRGGIPTGFRLFRKSGNEVCEIAPDEAGAGGDSLWLFPAGEIWQPTQFGAGPSVGEAEVGVEFVPESGFHSVLPREGDLDRHWLAAFLQGALVGVVQSLSRESQADVLAGRENAVGRCAERLDESLKPRGVRCRGIRNVHGATDAGVISASPDDGGLEQLAAEITAVKTPADWQRLVETLRMAGVPVDPPTSEKLAAMQESVLRREIPAETAVKQIATLTAEAFTRAGINEPDLSRWQAISERLGDPEAIGEEPAAPASVGVAVLRKPSTWFVWSRDEVDRRQLLFTRRTVKNCRLACEQGISSLRDIPALRQLRDLKEQLVGIEELLATVPPLDPPRSALRPDPQVAKALVASYADAVRSTDQLAQRIDALLNVSPSEEKWKEELQACQKAATRLAQLVRDRRSIR